MGERTHSGAPRTAPRTRVSSLEQRAHEAEAAVVDERRDRLRPPSALFTLGAVTDFIDLEAYAPPS